MRLIIMIVLCDLGMGGDKLGGDKLGDLSSETAKAVVPLRGEVQILRSKIATELLKWCSHLSSEVHVLEPILPHTLLQKRLALITGLGAEEFVRTNLPNIARDSHDIQIGTPKFADVTKLLHHILLGMNTMRRVS